MKFKHIKIVYKKELKDLLRDKKTVFSTFILPLVLFPAYNVSYGRRNG